ncbi:patatin-like phospholipase family protein [Legionella erythra]|uniref:Alpha-beta hydrolase family transporter esterase n=1 Tax=Legionella erythra TaxID=448 RepID=A0A0W0TV14_LEGER|nr:patatin-like phospholipase family protein [Legionella erythra]KTC99485.1 alpha-beta hydrolase family transporter esterase [Legionella erythra]
MAARLKPNRQHDYLACSLQGGGALGTYQVGVLQALQEANYFPDWFVGTSIGAINAALAAGNPPAERFQKMLSFWESVTTPTFFDVDAWHNDHAGRRWEHFMSAQSALWFGQPGFFTPRYPQPELSMESAVDKISYYDTSALKGTLERLIDFDRINAGETRLSVGAVEVCSGSIVYFDSAKETLGPEHIMASGALPPGFPAIEIEGKFYWDGGISSNSPISYVLSQNPSKTLLCFMVHLFNSLGLKPSSLDEVLKRKKDIEYSSRFAEIVNMHKEIHSLKYRIKMLSAFIPETAKDKNPDVEDCLSCGCDKTVALVRFLYPGDDTDLASKDYEFSRKSVMERIAAGYRDGRRGIERSPWHAQIPELSGIEVYDMAVTPTHLTGVLS